MVIEKLLLEKDLLSEVNQAVHAPNQAVHAPKPCSILKVLFAATFGVLVLSGCQPNKDSDNQVTTKSGVNSGTGKDNADIMSDEVTATIAAFETDFVNKVINLQEAELAEYEALRASDNTDSSLVTREGLDYVDETTSVTSINSVDQTEGENQTHSLIETPDSETTDETVNKTVDSTQTPDLEKLPLANNVAFVEPQILTEGEIISRYNVAMQSLYLADDVPLPAQAMDTLVNIATLIPDVFANPDLAHRLVVKSPALARLLKQYQTWQQILLQQKQELEALKQLQIEAQQQQTEELDALIKEFTAKIENYDEQIAKYEQMLKEFE